MADKSINPQSPSYIQNPAISSTPPLATKIQDQSSKTTQVVSDRSELKSSSNIPISVSPSSEFRAQGTIDMIRTEAELRLLIKTALEVIRSDVKPKGWLDTYKTLILPQLTKAIDALNNNEPMEVVKGLLEKVKDSIDRHRKEASNTGKAMHLDALKDLIDGKSNTIQKLIDKAWVDSAKITGHKEGTSEQALAKLLKDHHMLALAPLLTANLADGPDKDLLNAAWRLISEGKMEKPEDVRNINVAGADRKKECLDALVKAKSSIKPDFFLDWYKDHILPHIDKAILAIKENKDDLFIQIQLSNIQIEIDILLKINPKASQAPPLIELRDILNKGKMETATTSKTEIVQPIYEKAIDEKELHRLIIQAGRNPSKLAELLTNINVFNLKTSSKIDVADKKILDEAFKIIQEAVRVTPAVESIKVDAQALADSLAALHIIQLEIKPGGPLDFYESKVLPHIEVAIESIHKGEGNSQVQKDLVEVLKAIEYHRTLSPTTSKADRLDILRDVITGKSVTIKRLIRATGDEPKKMAELLTNRHLRDLIPLLSLDQDDKDKLNQTLASMTGGKVSDIGAFRQIDVKGETRRADCLAALKKAKGETKTKGFLDTYGIYILPQMEKAIEAIEKKQDDHSIQIMLSNILLEIAKHDVSKPNSKKASNLNDLRNFILKS